MYFRSLFPIAAALSLLTGCASTITQDGLAQRTAQALGRTPAQLTISDRSEETGGRINYTVATRDGATYRCYLYSATGFQSAMSFGQTPHSDAICTAVVGGQSGNSSTPPAAAAAQRGPAAGKECNALLRAAGRCG